MDCQKYIMGGSNLECRKQFARGEQTEESDLDIMVDFSKPIGWEVVDLRDELEKLLGIKVDLILKAGVMQRKRLYSQILEDAVYVKA
ncbi:MAG TPA: nucleotidyltransferase domain-containing protein [Methanospirillum sp.]|nr:nucleotidyltransferase domain-containing protein [Methanospirillum sp.]